MSVAERSTSDKNGAGKGGIRVNDYATPESRLKGAQRSAEVRAENAKSARQRLAERVQADVDGGYNALKKAWEAGEWRAFPETLNQAFGKPTEHMALDLQGSLEVEHTRRLTLADVASLASELAPAQAALEQGDDAASP